MHRKLIVMALLVTPALAAGQHPADSARDHPASSGHANAVAAETNATSLEACDNLSSALLDALVRGDFKSATSNFDAQMSSSLDSKKLSVLWASISARFGALQSRGFPQAAMYQDLFIVATPLYFAKGGADAQVVCDINNRIVGFHLRPSTPAVSH